MKLFKWSWTKLGIGIVVFIVTAILGRWSANYNIRKELGVLSSVNTEPQEDTDNILNDNLVYIDGKPVDMDSIPDNIVCIDGKLVNKDTKKVYSDINEVYSEMDSNDSFEDEIEKEKLSARVVNKIIIKKEYSVQAEVFRIVDGFYKDAHRKETIIIVELSNGITTMKKHLDQDTYSRTDIGKEYYSKLSGYEYQCLSIVGKDVKIYAYNESDKKFVKQ